MPTVTFAGDTEKGRETKTLEFNEDEILFNAFERKAIELPHGCLSGSCGACRIEIIEGAENLSPAGAIEKDTISHISNEYTKKYGTSFLEGKTLRLSCRAKIKGDLTFKTIDR